MDYDVIVVGAGPSGSTAAKTLAEKGIKVLIVDKERFPRDKPCGGGLPLLTLKEFSYLKQLPVIESFSYGGFVHSPTTNAKVKINKEEPVIAMIQRSKFDYELVRLAVDTGAEFQDQHHVTGISISQDKVQLRFRDGHTASAELIIGADGYHSTISRKTRLSQKKSGRGICVLQEIPLDRKYIEQLYTKNRFCHIYSKFKGIQGYGWVFPKKNHINIGIISYDTRDQLKKKDIDLKTIFFEYISKLKENHLIPANVQNIKIKSGLLPLQPLKKTYSNRLLMSGDAAGFINPITGEGIYYAMCSGKLAALTAEGSIQHQDTTEQYLSTYQKRWKQAFGKEINLFLLGKKQWSKQGETTIRLMNKDPVFADLIYSIFIGKESVYDLRWKIIKRFLYNKITLK